MGGLLLEGGCSISVGVVRSVVKGGDTQPLQIEPKVERGSERVEGGLMLEVRVEVSRLDSWELVGWRAGAVGGGGGGFVGSVEGAEVGVGVAMLVVRRMEVGRQQTMTAQWA